MYTLPVNSHWMVFKTCFDSLICHWILWTGTFVWTVLYLCVSKKGPWFVWLNRMNEAVSWNWTNRFWASIWAYIQTHTQTHTRTQFEHKTATSETTNKYYHRTHLKRIYASERRKHTAGNVKCCKWFSILVRFFFVLHICGMVYPMIYILTHRFMQITIEPRYDGCTVC